MTRQNFSIEHKKPWLDEPNAAKLYFDLNNVTFSHSACNKGAARKPTRKAEIDHGNYVNYIDKKCSCDSCIEAWNAYKRSRYTPELRRAKYDRAGT